MMNNPISRYPGIPPFTTEHKDVFFGRSTDINRLYNLVLTEKLVLLQSKSGLGKSSLINAGLIPLLQKSSDNVINCFRFNNYVDKTSMSPIENMVNTLEENNETVSFLHKLIPKENSLWYHYKTKQINDGRHLTFYLIFDQFEELFTYPDEFVFVFKKQMADLIYNSLPKNFQIVLNRKQENNEIDLPTVEEIKQLYRNLNIHVLFAIRADRMSEMDKLSDYIPTILRTRFELQPLQYEQIKEAIVEPAKKVGNYTSPAFKFQTKVVDEIIEYITKKGSISADTTQLQIICQRLEKRVPTGSKPGEFIVEKKHLPKFKDIVKEFYKEITNLINTEERLKTQKFIEDELIKKDQRIPVDQLVWPEDLGDKVLNILLENHLLRSEKNSTGGISYELAHDTLVLPIKEVADARRQCEKEDKDKRRQQEENDRIETKRQDELSKAKEKAENERMEREKEAKRQAELLALQQARAVEAEHAKKLVEENLENQLKAAKKQKKLMRLTIVIAFMFALAAIFGLRMMLKAKNNLQLAYNNLDRAELMQQKVETAMFDKAVKERFKDWNGMANYNWDQPSNDDTKKGIEILTKIDSLDLSNNALLRIPEDVARCPNLQHINLLGNSDIDWNASEHLLEKFKNHTDIYVAINDLSEIDSTYWNVITGIEIILNQSGKLPQNILQQKQLKYLDLSFNNLRALPDDIGKLTNLTTLNLSFNHFITIPNDIGKLTSLTTLILSFNLLNILPDDIGKLSNLTTLDLHSNQLSVLPDDIWKLRNLTTLYLSDNQLNTLPDDIGKLRNLTTLNLSFNELGKLPDNIWNLTNLTKLDLSFIELNTLSDDIGKLRNLTTLYLSGNQLRTLPEDIGKLTELTTLNLLANQLSTLPDGIWKLINLSTLVLHSNLLSSLPDDIEKLINLTSLFLSYNKLTELPENIWKLTNLTTLDLSSNPLNILTNDIGKLTNLTAFEFSDNQLTALPDDIGKLTKLNTLNLSLNSLSNLPDGIWKLTNLTAFDLSDNKLTALPDDLWKLINLTTLDLHTNLLSTPQDDMWKLINLTTLDLHTNQISDLPCDIGKLTNLTAFDLSDNQLTALPDDIGKLTELTSLNLSYNSLSTLPDDIGKLKSLNKLNLSGNDLSTLPNGIYKLTNLTTLNLWANELTTLPPEIRKLKNLKELDLSGNLLRDLPDDIGKLKSLNKLNLSGNDLSALPYNIWKLTDLTAFDLSDNQLSTLPPEIGKLTNLESLDLTGNQIKSIPNEVISLHIAISDFFEIQQMLVLVKNYEQAYLIAKELIVKKPGNYNCWFNLSFYCLFVGKFAEGIEAAQKTLELAPEKLSVITNLALGYVLSNQYDKAKPLYLEWKDKKFPDDERFAKDIFLQDIKNLEEAKITHPDFEKVRELLKE